MKKLLPLLTLVFLSFSACDDGIIEVANKDHFTFGRFAGHCLGDCFSVFRADAKSLTEDVVSEKYIGVDYEYTPGRTLSESEYALAKELLSEIPPVLLSSEKEVFGCPDCADQGGYYLEFKLNGIERTFRLDTRQTDDQTAELLTFKEKLSQLLEELND